MVVFAASVLVLLVSGGLKLTRPQPTAHALADLLPSPPRAGQLRWIARGIGLAELTLVAAAVATGGPWSGFAVSAAYVAFSAVVLAQLRAGGSGSCGCVGGDSPATGAHLLLTVGFAVGSALSPRLSHDPLVLMLGALLAGLALATMTAFADLQVQVRRVATPRSRLS